jgi:hypothetical protein
MGSLIKFRVQRSETWPLEAANDLAINTLIIILVVEKASSFCSALLELSDPLLAPGRPQPDILILELVSGIVDFTSVFA